MNMGQMEIVNYEADSFGIEKCLGVLGNAKSIVPPKKYSSCGRTQQIILSCQKLVHEKIKLFNKSSVPFTNHGHISQTFELGLDEELFAHIEAPFIEEFTPSEFRFELIDIPHIKLLVEAAVFLPHHDVLALAVFAIGDIENSLVLDIDEVSILISVEEKAIIVRIM